jgi:hypothetical protein
MAPENPDEAVAVLKNPKGPEDWTPEEKKILVRKVDKRLMPLLVITYGLQYYDKAMLSQAVRKFETSLRDNANILGTFRPASRSWPDYRRPIFVLRLHILPGFHCWELSCYPHGSALANGACRGRTCMCMGSLPDLLHCMYKLAELLRSAVPTRII